MLSVDEKIKLKRVRRKRLAFHFSFVLSLFLLFFFSLFFFVSPIHTQSTGDILITEIMYSTEISGDWIEIMNVSDSAVTMTGLTLQIGDGTAETIAVHSSTPADLAAGGVAVIVKDAATFTTMHSDSSIKIYTSAAINLPAENNTEIVLKKESTNIDTVIYNNNEFARRDGVSLHKTLGNVFLPAPTTPGFVAINPVSGEVPVVTGVSVSAHIADGTNGGDVEFVGTGDVITLYIIAQDTIAAPTASLNVGGSSKTVSLTRSAAAGGIMYSGGYTILSGDADGKITYAVEYTEGSASKAKTGLLMYDGRQVSIDTTNPSVSSTITDADVTTRKVVVFTITDKNPPTEIQYKVSNSTSCTTKEAYDGVSADEQKAPVENGQARIVLSSSDDNTKYICVKITDKAEHTVYGVSSQISGIAATSGRITELVYAPTDGANFEWIEITNKSDSNITITDFKIVDGGTDKSISAVRQNQNQDTSVSLESGQIAIIVRNETNFRTKYPAYSGPLFKSSFSLNDTGDTIGLKSPDSVLVDQVSYVKSDGAYRNNKSLHIKDDGSIFENSPSPGTATNQDGTSPQALQFVPTYSNDVLVRVRQFNGQDIIEGQNLFFTAENSATISFTMKDEDTDYTEENIGSYLTEESTATTASSYRVVRDSVTEQSEGGVVEVIYTIHFSALSGSHADNRITVYPKLTDDNSNVSSKRSAVTVVRNTTIPSLAKVSTATSFGFPSNESVVVPIAVSGLALGDWLRPIYGGSCGDGFSSYIAKNGGHGVYYSLSDGSYTDCTISATDSAGNSSSPLNLPNIIVGQA